MNKIKIFTAPDSAKLQIAIDKWIAVDRPTVISSSIAKDGSWLTISIVYSDSPNPDVADLLLS